MEGGRRMSMCDRIPKRQRISPKSPRPAFDEPGTTRRNERLVFPLEGDLMQGISVVACALIILAAAGVSNAAAPTVEQWDVFEASFDGPKEGNPFADVSLGARFTSGDATYNVTGFYDGDGVYRI